MRITFRGWRREVYPHTHEVTPVKKDNRGLFAPIPRRKSVEFSDGMKVLGKFNGLELTGNFLAIFEFTEAELRSWLMSYFEKNPESAQKLILKVLSDVAARQEKQRTKLEEKLTRTTQEMQRAADRLQEQWVKTEYGSDEEKRIEAVKEPLQNYLEKNF